MSLKKLNLLSSFTGERKESCSHILPLLPPSWSYPLPYLLGREYCAYCAPAAAAPAFFLLTIYTDFFFFKKVRLFQHPQKDNKPLWSIFFKKGRIITITQQQGVSHFLRPRKKSVTRELPCSKCEKTSQRLHKNIVNCMKVKRLVKKYHHNRWINQLNSRSN